MWTIPTAPPAALTPAIDEARRAGHLWLELLAMRELHRHGGCPYDEFREVGEWRDVEDLWLLRDSGVINSPHSGLIKKWTSRWTRIAALQSAFAFLEPGDLGTVVAAFFVSDVALASAAHGASMAALRAGGRRRTPLAVATDIITAV